jgi:uncharacterized protein involved in exopolysaccharide biosynthesis
MVIQMTARGLLNSVFRQRRAFLSVFLLFVGLGTAYCIIATPIFESTSAFIVKFGGREPSAGQMSMTSVSIPAEQAERREIMNTQALILASDDLLIDVIKQVGPLNIYPGPPSIFVQIVHGIIDMLPIPRTPMTERQQLQDILERLTRDLRVDVEKDSNVVTIRLRNPDPDIAVDVLNKIVTQFRERQAQVYSGTESKFLADQVEEARAKLSASQLRLQQFLTDSAVNSLEDERTGLYLLQGQVQKDYVTAQARISEAESRRDSLLGSLKKVVETVSLSDEGDRYKSVDDARSRLADLVARRAELHNYRDDSTTVRDLVAQVHSAEDQLNQRMHESVARTRTGVNPVFQQIQIDLLRAEGDLRAARGSAEPMEGQLATIQKRLDEIAALLPHYQELVLQREVDEESYRTVMQRAEDSRIADALNRQNISSISVVQQPTVPVKPTLPRIPLIIAISLVAGVIAGFGASFALESMDEAFSLPDQVQPVTGLPVMAVFAAAQPPR